MFASTMAMVSASLLPTTSAWASARRQLTPSSDRTNDQMTQTNARGDKAEAWTAGLKYDANDIYLATMYSGNPQYDPVRQMTAWPIKHKNFEVTAQYQFDFGLRPAISYLQSKGKDLIQ